MAAAPRVLVADDDGAMRTLLTQLLEEEFGAEVHAVGDGLVAMAALAGDPYDAALLDRRMPRADGFAVLRWLASRPPEARVPAVFCTGSIDLDRPEALRLGAVACVAKPFDLEEFTIVLRAILVAPAD